MIAACAGAATGSRGITETLTVTTTAYCLQGRTASGLPVGAGAAAADPDVLPLGSVIRLVGTDGATPHDGVYMILDTGRHIQGRRVDIHIRKCADARRFGRRNMVAEVVRRGWPEEKATGEPSTGSRGR